MSTLTDLEELPLPQIHPKRVRWFWKPWEIFTKHSDGIERPLNPMNPRFWRWIVAARIAGTMKTEINTAAWIALESKK